MAVSTSLLTTKRQLAIGELTLASGVVLPEVTLGYETYGALNAARDNAILICHFFSGSSHAAGRYSPEDPLPGWWDPVIGPGKAIDTDRYYVVAVDALGCMRKDLPHNVTTGPASPNPATGQPYGPDFPLVTIADMVASQRKLLDLLGIGRLAAVMGPSMGAMQALEWAVSRPTELELVVASIGLAELRPRVHAMYLTMEEAIRLDPAFAGGRYAPDATLTGLSLAVQLMWFLSSGHHIPFAPDHLDAEAFERWVKSEGALRATACDANAMIGLLRANARWRLGDVALEEAVKRVRARVLLLPGADDLLLPVEVYMTPLAEALAAAGCDVRVEPLPATYGHLAGLVEIGKAEQAIREALNGAG